MATASDFYTMTPGSAVASTLQDILTRRKTEQRQAMLDKMAAEEQSSVISAREESQRMARENLALQQQQEARQKLLNEAQMREMEQQGLEREMGHLAPGTKDVDIQDPELQKYIEKTGGFRQTPVSPDMPAVTGDIVEGATMERQYAGTPKEQAEADQRKQAADIIGQIQNEQDPQKRQALSFQLVQLGVDPRQIPEMLARQQLVTATGKVIPIQNAPMVPASEANKFLGYPPNYGGSSASTARSNYQITMPNGQQEVRSMTLAQVAEEEKKGNKVLETGVQSLVAPGVASTDRKALMDAKTMLDAARSSSTWFGMGGPDPKKLAVAESQYRSALSNVFGADPATPKIKDIALKIAMHPQLSQMSTQELVQSVKQLEGVTDKDIHDLDRLLNYSRGNPEAIFAVQ